MCTYGPLFGISKIKLKFETSKIDVHRGGIMVFLGFFCHPQNLPLGTSVFHDFFMGPSGAHHESILSI